MTSVRLVGPLDPNFAWSGTRLYDETDFHVGSEPPYDLRGAAASVRSNGSDAWRILRDPLGINKLFWARDVDGIAMAARPRRLIAEGRALDQLRAIPRGCVVDLISDQSEPVHSSILPAIWSSRDHDRIVNVDRIAREIRSTLDNYLAAIASAYPTAEAFVCLSGGLDSSGIVALARDHFSNLTAVSFDLERGADSASDDRIAARRLVRDLGIPLLEATLSEGELFDMLDTVLVEGIDWRDFNVHAALVNAGLARTIRDTLGDRRTSSAIVMTGDLANEFLADYQPEVYKAAIYYSLPRLPRETLRASLIHGLDTCHREIGVFGAWDLAVVQPYAVAADSYLALSGEFLALEDRKARLSRTIFGNLLPEYAYSRAKVRAQVGSSSTGAGVLTACVDSGFDSAWLRRRFANLHEVTDLAVLDRFIRAGRYRAELPSYEVV